MQRSFLIIAVALLALIAGALFYFANAPVDSPAPIDSRAPVASPAPVDSPIPAESAALAMPPQPEVVQFPAFTLKDIDGNDRAFSEYHGRHRLLNFWATWCAPCRREIPLLKDFQDEQSDDGILMMGIAVDFPEDVARFAEVAEFNYPILVGQEDAMAVAESSGITFIAMPFTMIVSREGEYLSAYLGELHRSHLDEISSVLSRLDSGELDSDSARSALDSL